MYIKNSSLLSPNVKPISLCKRLLSSTTHSSFSFTISSNICIKTVGVAISLSLGPTLYDSLRKQNHLQFF